MKGDNPNEINFEFDQHCQEIGNVSDATFNLCVPNQDECHRSVEKTFEISSETCSCKLRAKLNISVDDIQSGNEHKIDISFSLTRIYLHPFNYSFSNSDFSCSADKDDKTISISLVKNTDLFCHRTLLLFTKPNKTWIEALQHCHKLNSSLVQITNTTVRDEVTSLVKNKSGVERGVWVGLERSIFGTDLEWKWTSGSTVEGNVLPMNSSFYVDRFNNHCGKIFLNQSEEIQWLDASCHDGLPYICQGPE
ncbi:lithostathine-like isoform X2 [Kryptolebias marmoratus]|uniref:lithostathine-like isoform X2 n=1 Tax=Kryptolebias marmoratus TaxID=37003 RepID=UPI0018ACDE92|nr:lithostathine-like isoform X2 [Kryptolebias marmoratus]